MREWTVDADDIRVARDFDESLLLKAKRVLCQQAGQAICLPSGTLLDKPIGDKIFGREAIAFFAASPLPSAKAWLAAIAVAVLEHVDETEGPKVNPRLASLIDDRHPA